MEERANKSINLVLYGGWAGFHVGDDAILEATISEVHRHCNQLNIRPEITLLCSTIGKTKQLLGDIANRVSAFENAPRVFMRAQAEKTVASTNSWTRNLARANYLWLERKLRSKAKSTLQPNHKSNCDMARAFRAIRDADALILCGGGYMTSEMRLPWLYPTIELINFAALLETKCWITGQTIGPITSQRDRNRAKRCFGVVEKFGLRDSRSVRLLQDSFSVDPQRLTSEADIALSLVIETVPGSKRQNKIAISLQPRGEKPLDVVVIKRMLEEFPDYCFVLLPHTPEDLIYLNELAYELNEQERISIVNQELPVSSHLQILANCSAAMGTRFHFSVLAFATCTPCIGLLDNLKSRGLYEDFEAEDRHIPISHDSVERIVKTLRESVENQEALSYHIRNAKLVITKKCGTVLRNCVDSVLKDEEHA